MIWATTTCVTLGWADRAFVDKATSSTFLSVLTWTGLDQSPPRLFPDMCWVLPLSLRLFAEYLMLQTV